MPKYRPLNPKHRDLERGTLTIPSKRDNVNLASLPVVHLAVGIGGKPLDEVGGSRIIEMNA